MCGSGSGMEFSPLQTLRRSSLELPLAIQSATKSIPVDKTLIFRFLLTMMLCATPYRSCVPLNKMLFVHTFPHKNVATLWSGVSSFDIRDESQTQFRFE